MKLASHAFWGDSLTDQMLATVGNAVTAGFIENVYDGGVGGDTSTQCKVRFLADATRRHWNQVIWIGYNNFSSGTTVKADIAAMVAQLNHSRYIIVSVLNNGNTANEQGPSGAGYLQIKQLNADLAALYGSRFYDLRAALVAYGVSIADANSVSYDAPPSTIQPVNIHLNATGYNSYAGPYIRAAMSTLGYLSADSLTSEVSASGGT